MEIRSATQAEQMYTYAQSMQIQGQTGSIGYLRGDFGKNGNEFYANWTGHRKQWKTDEFKEELDTVINDLRSDEYGLLKNLKAMQTFTGQHPESGADKGSGRAYYFRLDTKKHTFLLRCSTRMGDYNFYCFCYVSEWLDKHMKKAEKGIQFIDSRYKELFRIPDGEEITVTNSLGEKHSHYCRFIDEYHTEIGRELYHSCQFAEMLENSGSHCEPKAQLEMGQPKKSRER